MGKKLFVGSLSWGTDNEGLRKAFEEHGEVDDAVVIKEKHSGRSRGFGFVTYVEDADAQTAIEKMDGAELDGREIRVNEANDRPPRKNFGGGGRDFGGGGFNQGGGGDFGDNRRRPPRGKKKGGRGGDKWDRGGRDDSW